MVLTPMTPTCYITINQSENYAQADHVGFLCLRQVGLLLVAVHGLLVAVASLAAENGL